MSEIIQKNGVKLTPPELKQIDEAKDREFDCPPMEKEQIENSTFFLLKEGANILAMGQLSVIEPIGFNNESFSILGIGGIIANKKGKGYGKQIMGALTDYLTDNDVTGVGFCATHNKDFYEKVGYKVDTSLIERFVFNDNGKSVTNSEDDCVLYIDSSDNFVEKILSRPDTKMVLPRPPDW